MVVPDDWSVVHTRFIVDHSHGVFCGRVLVGGEIYKGYVICVSSKSARHSHEMEISFYFFLLDHRLLLRIRGIYSSNFSFLPNMSPSIPANFNGRRPNGSEGSRAKSIK